MEYNNILALFNVLLYSLTFLIYQFRTKYFGAFSILLLTYLFTALMGYFYINNPLSEYQNIKIFPFLYLYAMLMLACYPLFKVGEHNIILIKPPNNKLFNSFCWIMILAKTIHFLMIFHNLKTNFYGILFEPTTIFEQYSEGVSRSSTEGYRNFNLFAIFSNLFSTISILILMYYLTFQRKNIWLLIGLVFSAILNPIEALAQAQRGGVVISLLLFIFAYFFFKKFYSVKIQKIIKPLLIFIFLILSIPLAIITITRFSDREGDNFLLFSIQNYSGQSFINFNNYALDAGGDRDGTRTATLITTIISGGSAPRNYLERLSKYKNIKLDETKFSTFVGDFVLDFGPALTIFIFFLATVFFRHHLRIKNEISFHQTILWFLLINICAGLFLYTFADWGGNLQFIALISFYLIFRIKLRDNSQINQKYDEKLLN